MVFFIFPHVFIYLYKFVFKKNCPTIFNIQASPLQVEPLGVEWAASNYYGNPAGAMGVHYLRYKIEPEESSLVELYGHNDSVITDPEGVYAMGYRLARSVYLDQQDVRVNVARFRKTIIEALNLVKR